jgi:hypothetical protein
MTSLDSALSGQMNSAIKRLINPEFACVIPCLGFILGGGAWVTLNGRINNNAEALAGRRKGGGNDMR